MQILCYDIGGTDIKYGVVEDGEIIYKSSMKTSPELGRASLEERLIQVALEIVSKYDIKAVGVSSSGSIDCKTGKVLIPGDKIKIMKDMDFSKLFRDSVGLEVAADNDVNCFGEAESKTGAGIKYDNFLMMTIGTGIGGAIIYEDKVMHGLNYNAGEFGRMLLGDTKFEDLASTSALIKNAKDAGLKVDNGLDLYKLYDANDPVARKVVGEFYHYLAIGIANLVYIFNPEAIMIGGGISNRETLTDEIKVELKKILQPEFFNTITIENSIHKNEGGLLGAYFNAVNKLRLIENGGNL